MAGISEYPQAMQPPPQQFMTYAVPQEVPEVHEDQEDDHSSFSRVSGEDVVPAEQPSHDEQLPEDSMDMADLRIGVPDEMGSGGEL